MSEIERLNYRLSTLEEDRLERDAKIELLTKLLTECAQYVPLNVMECNGHKCREPWCASCNDEADAREAVDEANAFLQRVRSVLDGKEKEETA